MEAATFCQEFLEAKPSFLAPPHIVQESELASDRKVDINVTFSDALKRIWKRENDLNPDDPILKSSVLVDLLNEKFESIYNFGQEILIYRGHHSLRL